VYFLKWQTIEKRKKRKENKIQDKIK